MKVIDYERVNSVQDSDVLLIDGNRGTKTIYVGDLGFVNEETISEQRVLGAKNLFINTATTETKNGITLTVNSDDTLTLNGTSTAEAVFNIMGSTSDPLTSPWQDSLKGYDLRLTGCPSDGADDKYLIGLVKNDGTESRYRDYGEGITFNYTTGTYRAYITVRNGVTINNKVFKPMLRLASDPDNTYVPYAMTNRELTEEMSIKGITSLSDIYSQYDSSITFNPLWVFKMGKIVFIRISLTGTFQTNTWTTIGTLKAIYCPIKSINFAMVNAANGNPCAWGEISSAGIVKVYQKTGSSLTALDASVMYFTR